MVYDLNDCGGLARRTGEIAMSNDPSGTNPALPLFVPGSRRRTLLITCSAALIVFACLGGFFLLGGVGLSSIFGEPDVAVEVSAPPAISRGDSFAVTVSVTNTGQGALTVTEVQLPKNLLEGADVTGVSPASNGTTDYAGQVGYRLTLEIPSGQSRVITFQLSALWPGQYGGTLGVLSGRRTKNSSVQVTIEP